MNWTKEFGSDLYKLNITDDIYIIVHKIKNEWRSYGQNHEYKFTMPFSYSQNAHKLITEIETWISNKYYQFERLSEYIEPYELQKSFTWQFFRKNNHEVCQTIINSSIIKIVRYAKEDFWKVQEIVVSQKDSEPDFNDLKISYKHDLYEQIDAVEVWIYTKSHLI